MKPLRLSILLLSGMLIFGCVPREEFNPAGEETPTVEGRYCVKASYAAMEDTKSALIADTMVVWTSGDSISILNKNGDNAKFILKSGSNKNVGTFTGDVNPGGRYGLFPYSEEAVIKSDTLHFSVPGEQYYNAASFAATASPALAYFPEGDSCGAFKNLFGVICLQLCGPTATTAKMVEIIDNSGAPLWGDCSLVLDGTEGTDSQKMIITGGDNKLTVNAPSSFKFYSATPRKFYFAVPAGSFKSGFSIRVYDFSGSVIALLTAPSSNPVNRSTLVLMPKNTIMTNFEPTDIAGRGYYGDIFMDGGINLTSRKSLPAAPYLNLSLEYFASTSDFLQLDTLYQTRVFAGYAKDENGVLLYPDNEPRFRMIYVNGGSANVHGISLGETARNNIKTFVANGGSYLGSCAGAYFGSRGSTSLGDNAPNYLGLWPGVARSTGIKDSYLNHDIVEGSPLLKYYDYGGDMKIEQVYHNGGCYISDYPEYTEVLTRYNTPGLRPDGHTSVWAYKPYPDSARGRTILCGSHPEGVSSGERRDLMAAMIRYALEGNGIVTTKGELQRAETRSMTKVTSAKDPSHAQLGDRQYHHFTIDVPEGVRAMTVRILAETGYNVGLALRKGDFAWLADADAFMVNTGNKKVLTIEKPEAGIWYVSVIGMDTVTTTVTSYAGTSEWFQYGGNLDLLNGISYNITAIWN